jgi:hypothetical protein
VLGDQRLRFRQSGRSVKPTLIDFVQDRNGKVSAATIAAT